MSDAEPSSPQVSKNGKSRRCTKCNMWNTIATKYRPGSLVCKRCEARQRSLFNATKRCLSCNVIKPRDAFSKDSARASGLQTYCKLCMSNKAKLYRERLECVQCGTSYSTHSNPHPYHCKDCQ